MKRINPAEICVSAVLIAAAAFFLFASNSISGSSLGDPIGPKAFPVAVFWLIIVLCAYVTFVPLVLQFAQSGASRRQQASTAQRQQADRKVSGSGTQARTDALQIWAVVITMLAYALFWKYLGFVLTTVIFVAVLSLVLAPKAEKSPLKSILVAAAVTGVVYLAFAKGFHVELPYFSLFQ